MFILLIGDDTVLSSTTVGKDLDKFIDGLTLQLTDQEKKSPIYYINVVAINGAGVASVMKSSRCVEYFITQAFYFIS